MFARVATARTTSSLSARGLSISGQLQRSCFSSTASRCADFTHAVIGGGVVGLAVARQLAGREGTSTLLLEANGAVGMETSSRNSEVIHAGLYYPRDSLKTRLCIEGRHLLYSLCARHQIPHARLTKWILAQDESQLQTVASMHAKARSLGIPTRWIAHSQAAAQEPDVRARAGILESPTTGIVDSHALMLYLLGDFEERGGTTALMSRVTRIEAQGRDARGGYRIYTNGSTEPGDSIVVETLVNAAGLQACAVNNMVLPRDRHRTPYFAKGTYFSYASSYPRPRRLLYPTPKPGAGGLGTHLTLDLTGRVRFGPDVEWVSSPENLAPSPGRLREAVPEIKEYLPGLVEGAVDLDYCGIRPKLSPGGAVMGKGFQDFVVQGEEGFEGFVNLLGIESPGLTSSLAIARMVEGLLYE